MTSTVLAAGTEGGGAALDQVIGLSVAATVVTAVLLVIGYRHRTRRITWLSSLGDRVARWLSSPR